MTNKTILALTTAITPLVGTELVPVWDGATKKVTVADLTNGRDVQVKSVIASNAAIGTYYGTFSHDAVTTGANLYNVAAASGGGHIWQRGGAKQLELDTNSNLIPLAAKGINFTANTPAAGMTSQLLNWYEEGTWTPNQGAGLTVVGAFSSSGTYTRIGRQVTVRGQVVGATSVAVVAAGVMSSNLPFAASVSHAGSMFNSAVTTSGVVQITVSSVVAATTIAATPNITFTATYTV